MSHKNSFKVDFREGTAKFDPDMQFNLDNFIDRSLIEAAKYYWKIYGEYAYEQANKNGQSPTMPPLKQLTEIKKSLDYLGKADVDVIELFPKYDKHMRRLFKHRITFWV